MRFFRLLLSAVCLWAFAAHAGVPDFQRFPAAGQRLLLWVASERGRSEPELAAARQLAAQGVEVWSLDPANAYFLPQVPSSMDALPLQELSAWLRAADARGKRVVVFAVGRAAVPVLRAAALLGRERRSRLCVMLMHPNLYTTAEPLSAPAYLDLGDLSGLRVRVLQPRRSAATPWLSGLTDHLGRLGATTSAVILENLREGYWAREAPTAFETAERGRMGAIVLHQLDIWGCE